MASKAEIGALLRQQFDRPPQEGDDALISQVNTQPSTPQPEPTQPARRFSRRHAVMGIGAVAVGIAGFGASQFGSDLATPAKAEVPGTTDPIALEYGQVPRLVTQGREEDGEGPHTTLTIIPSPDLNVSNGTLTEISELKVRFPGSQNTEATRVTDVVHITEPGEPLLPIEIKGYAKDLNTDDTNGVVELRPNKRIAVTIFERGSQPLETGRMLAHKEDTVPPFSTPTP